jgi:hypothetical protein
MDSTTFATLTRSLTAPENRRWLLRALAGLPLGASLLAEEGAARRKGSNQREQNQRQSGSDKANRKGQRKDQDQAQDDPTTPASCLSTCFTLLIRCVGALPSFCSSHCVPGTGNTIDGCNECYVLSTNTCVNNAYNCQGGCSNN